MTGAGTKRSFGVVARMTKGGAKLPLGTMVWVKTGGRLRSVGGVVGGATDLSRNGWEALETLGRLVQSLEWRGSVPRHERAVCCGWSWVNGAFMGAPPPGRPPRLLGSSWALFDQGWGTWCSLRTGTKSAGSSGSVPGCTGRHTRTGLCPRPRITEVRR